jgi:hypothetical protein
LEAGTRQSRGWFLIWLTINGPIVRPLLKRGT